MPTAINYEQLRNFLLETNAKSLNFQDMRVYNSLNLVLATGCRACEVNLNYWEILNETTIILTPSKRNLQRSFLWSEVPKDWINAIYTQNSVDFTQSYSTLERGFESFKGAFRLTLNKKELQIHAYRHLYAKTLALQGLTDIQIQLKMGEKWLTSAQKYIYSQIFNEFL